MKQSESSRNLELVCPAFIYTFSPQGDNLSFTDVCSGVDYCAHTASSKMARITQGKETYSVSSVEIQENQLILQFKGSKLTARLEIFHLPSYVTIEVLAVEGGEFDSFEFLDIPLTLQGRMDEPFGACALALNGFTRVEELPTLQARLHAVCYPRFGVAGAKIALIGAQPADMLPILRQVVSAAPELPSLRNAGAWAEDVPFNHGSYLFNFGNLTEDTVEDWIRMVKSLGFNQIDNHGGTNFHKFGSLELNRDKWPDGWDTFKRIVARLHEAGIASILHTYSFFIDKHSEFVTPVPSPYLDTFRSFTLSQPVGPDDTTIYVNESTADVSTITGFMEVNSVTLHIGDELVNFGGVTKQTPFAFTECTRGAFATAAAAHPQGAVAGHLKEYYGGFVPDCESPLFEEIARRHAEVVDYVDFDAVYFDAIDGSHILRGREDGWYWGQQFVYLIYNHLKKRISMEMSAMWHQMWNLRSRYQAWDYPLRGYKRFIDMHLDHITAKLQLPLQLGWWNFHYAQPPQIESHSMDVLDYLGAKMIGHNAGLSLTGAVNSASLRDIPLYRRLVDRLRIYEELRQNNYFDDVVRARLREPGKEFVLAQQDSKWQFSPAQRSVQLVAGKANWTSSWQVVNPYRTQPLQLDVAVRMSTGAYDDPGNLTLADMSLGDPSSITAAQGVNLTIAPAAERLRPNLASTKLTALNSGLVPANAAWARWELLYDPWLDLSQRQAIGVWVYGDGNNELLNIRLETPHHIAMGAIADHYIDIDFYGWRYFSLVETESGRWSDFSWGDHTNYYSAFRETIDFKAVSRLSVWLNNLPAGKTVTCCLSPIVALPMVNAEIRNPELRVNDALLRLPVTLVSGDTLELDASGSCTQYDVKGENKGQVKLEQVPQLQTGVNALEFVSDTPSGPEPRLAVTTIAVGEPL
ncbi:MAG: hypothetical protein ACYC6L_05565 [Anaerolineae bacterium]